jgi:hypothetical protein
LHDAVRLLALDILLDLNEDRPEDVVRRGHTACVCRAPPVR